MTNYEYLMERIQHCKEIAAETEDERIAKFHECAAKGFCDRAMAMTVAEAEMELEGAR